MKRHLFKSLLTLALLFVFVNAWGVSQTSAIKTSPAAVVDKFTAGETIATLTVDTKYTATFMFNNTKWYEVALCENEGLVFPDAPEVEGYVFTGWTNSTTINVDGSGINYAKEGDIIQSNTTYHAVFAVQEVNGEKTEKLTTGDITNLDELKYTAPKYSTDGAIKYLFFANKNATGNPWFELKKDEGCYVKISAPFMITKMEVSITSMSNSSGGVNDISKHSPFTGLVALTKEDCTFSTSSPNIASVSGENLVKNVAILVPGEIVSEVFLKVSVGARIWGINVTYANVSYSNYTITPIFPEFDISISSAGKATACVGFDATVSGAKAYYISSVGDGIAQLTEVVGTIPAGTGVFLMMEGGEGSAIFTPAALGTGDVTLAQDNMLKGTVYPSGELFNEQGHTYYALRNGEHGVCFYWDPDTQDKGASAKCACGKAILDVPSTGSASSSSIGIRFDGASLIENTDLNEEKCYHDFLGHKVEKPSTGLYIVNGKKILVK